MITTQQPEALRLADKYEAHGFLGDHRFAKEHWCSQAATELRRQHARIAELEAERAAIIAEKNECKYALRHTQKELEAQLSAIGAGGVEPLRKPAAVAVPDEREAFEKWLRVKPCGAAHDFAWEAWKARAALAATQPAAQGMEQDAARWRMVVLISRETMVHPDKRTAPEAVAAYMHAVHSGLDIQGAIDAAIRARTT